MDQPSLRRLRSPVLPASTLNRRRLRQFHARRAVLRIAEAWIELAEIVQDDRFRAEPRNFFHRAFGTEQGKLPTTPEMPARAERQRELYLEARAGVPADSPQARDIAARMAADSADFET
ncbi:hypothetical protein [Amycolatopsis sp. Hca4]|uniref:hypothetical protein n=1 Tax=Amycolatopsis sp. Hca4 TaxID=2742131 RepID=UPI0020CA9F88|nr:hypothetical protein [Amycolatopsis sp. Hca4]